MARDTCVATAAVSLTLHYPFWCELYYTMKVVEDQRVPTLATDGKVIYVNTEYWDKLTHDYRVTALAHETCHKMYHHPTRIGDRDHMWSNIAMDIVVNTALAENGFKIHPNWVQPRKDMKGWSFERVYDAIYPKDQPPPQDGKGQQKGGGSGGGKAQKGSSKKEQADGEGEGDGDPEGSGFCDRSDIPKEYKGAWSDVKQLKGSKEEIDAHEEKVDRQVSDALDSAKAMGCAPAGVEMAAKHNARVAEEKWYDHLHRYFQSLRLSEFDWARVNKRQLVTNRIVAPVQYSPRMGPIWVWADASGSCYSQAQQAQFMTHLNAIISEAQPEELWFGTFDTIPYPDSYQMVPLGEMEMPPVRTIGGGGTSFTQLFDAPGEQGVYPHAMIILTDMIGTFPTEAPPYPVIWASVLPDIKAPFGETIFVK